MSIPLQVLREDKAREGQSYVCEQCSGRFIKGTSLVSCLVLHVGSCCHYTDKEINE